MKDAKEARIGEKSVLIEHLLIFQQNLKVLQQSFLEFDRLRHVLIVDFAIHAVAEMRHPEEELLIDSLALVLDGHI